ncbi:MAG: YhbY family RNA-binding protein [Candidatus Bathyarchaeia archaeon]
MRGSSVRRKGGHMKATVRIGKKGVTETQIREIFKQLEARKRVKVKVLRSALVESSVEEIAQKVASKTGSKVVQIIGHTFTLYKPKRKISIIE